MPSALSNLNNPIITNASTPETETTSQFSLRRTKERKPKGTSSLVLKQMPILGSKGCCIQQELSALHKKY
jgi:hypothetical protein